MKIIKLVILIIIFLFSACAIAVVGFFYYSVTQPSTPGAGYVDITIEPGQKKLDVAELLDQKGVIRSKWLILGYWTFTRQIVKNGKYSLSANDNIIKIADILANNQVNDIKVLIKEGESSWQIAKTLSEKKLVDYNVALADLAKNEGYLFPDTYRIAENSTIGEIIQTLKGNFEIKTSELNPTKDQVIIASLLEREGKNYEEKIKISGVIQNRLKIDMTLDLDATVQFAKGSWAMIKRDDIVNTNSLFNTYKNKGLPPSPICNPGLDSIKAAISPEPNNFYYYFHSREEKLILSKNLTEHNINIAKYGVSGS